MKKFKESKRKSDLLLFFVCLLWFIICCAPVFFTAFFSGKEEKASALTIPEDYGIDLDAEFGSGAAPFEGVFTLNETDKRYSIQGVKGFVTLARASQKFDFEGYTFVVDTGLFQLSVNYDASNEIVVADSFFGFGNEKLPFKGTLVKSESPEDVYLELSTWKYLFNNISNEAAVKAANNGGKIIMSQNAPFSFCDMLTVTKAETPFDIGGFRFSAENGDAGVVAQSDTAGLVACRVTSNPSNLACSIDLSDCFNDAEKYALTTSNGTAGGLFGIIGSDVSLTVRLNSLNVSVTAVSGHAGLIAGRVDGTLVVSSATEDSNCYFTGTVQSDENHAAGGIAGFVSENGSLIATDNLNLYASLVGNENLTVKGQWAGGVAGYSAGKVQIEAGKNCTVKNDEFICLNEAGAAGGIVGEAIVAPVGNFIATTNSFSDRGDLGGFIGKFTAREIAFFESVKVTISSFDESNCTEDNFVGGYFGSVTANAVVTLKVTGDSSFSFGNIENGYTGGVAGGVFGSSAMIAQGNAMASTINNTFGFSSSTGCAGGVAGKVGSGVYFRGDELSIENTYSSASKNRAEFVCLAADGAKIDAGNIAYRSDCPSVFVNETGVGAILRLSGNISDNSTSFNHIVKEQKQSLLYADKNFSFSYPSVLTGNDVGNYGQIYRNDKLDFINFTDLDYSFSFTTLPFDSSKIEFSEAADAAKYALTVQTKGAISAVAGITKENYTSLLAVNIFLINDIDLTGTGAEQLTDSSLESSFTGSVDGNGKTITLSVGENLKGENSGILTADNARRYMGIFSCGKDATVNNLIVAGKIDYRGNVGTNVYAGGIFGKVSGKTKITNCTSRINISLSSGRFSEKVENLSLCAGGFIGYAEGEVGITNGVAESSLTQTSGYGHATSTVYMGGLIAKAEQLTAADLSGNTIKVSIEQTKVYNAHVGGVAAEMSFIDYTELNLKDTTSVSGITVNAEASAGGLIGLNYEKCKIVLNKEWGGTVKNTGNGSFGGLIHSLSGEMTVENGFMLTAGMSANGTKKGGLIASGEESFVVISCDPSAFETVEKGFDLFVGSNVKSNSSVGIPQAGGVVTIETETDPQEKDFGKIPETSDWYNLFTTHTNARNRYYFNVAKLQKRNATSVVSSSADLVYLSLYCYAEGSLPDYVMQDVFPNAVTSITGATQDVNVQDVCFYPTASGATVFSFSGRKLTFGAPTNTDVAGIPQFKGLNTGVFSDIRTSGTVEFCDAVLAGELSSTGNESGVFVLGTLEGSNRESANVTVKNVFFDGLRVADLSENNYRPLLINKIASYVNCTIENVSQYTPATYDKSKKETSYAAGTKAASSLIGYGGVLTNGVASSEIRITFNKVVFDGYGTSAVFARAIFFEAINCVSGAGTFLYNFDLAEDWNGDVYVNAVTYGLEIYENTQQQMYFDKDYYVSPESATASSLYDGFKNLLYYVCAENGRDSFFVNRKVYEFLNGYGTYRNPYDIDRSEQFIFLSQLLSTSDIKLTDGWRIQLPADIKANHGDSVLYTYSDTDKKLRGESGGEVSVADLTAFLRGAYYKFSVKVLDLTDFDFAGLGSAGYPFHGVLVGADEGTLIKIHVGENIESDGFAGLINVSNGAAAYNLQIEYDAVTLNYSLLNGVATSLPLPSSTAAQTSNVHFGGVIGWVIGGDNIVENVSVSYRKAPSTNALTNGYPPVFGGYVGLVSGGGVILKNLGLQTVSDAAWWTSAAMKDKAALYFNPYVGKVVYGYAFSTDRKYENGEKGCYVPYLSDVCGKNVVKPYESSKKTFYIADREEFIMLSYALSNGAMTYNVNSVAYGGSALSRYGDYSLVGKEGALVDEKGFYADEVREQGNSIFTSYFGFEKGNYQRAGLTLRLTGKSYDLSDYGNAFRGLGIPYFDISNINGVSGGSEIIVNTDVKYYYGGNVYEPDTRTNLALFYERAGAGNVSFSDITLKGKMSLSFIDEDGTEPAEYLFNKPFCVAGFVAYSYGTDYTNVSIDGLTVKSPAYAGGFTANEDYAAGRVGKIVDCAVKNSCVEGKLYAGGFVGFPRIQSTAVSTYGDITVSDSLIVAGNASGNAAYAGGIFGYLYRQNRDEKFTLTDINVTGTTILAFTDGNACAGGIVGNLNCNAALSSCVVDGCSVVAREYKAVNVSSAANYDVTEDIDNLKARANCYAGGFVGYAAFNQLSVTEGALTSDKKESVVAGYTFGGGLIGMEDVAQTVNIEKIKISVTKNAIKLLAGKSAGGLIGEGNGTATVTISCVCVNGVKDKLISICAKDSSTQNNNGKASGLIAWINGATNVSDAEIRYTTMEANNVAGVVGEIGGGSSSATLSLEEVRVLQNTLQGDLRAAGVVNFVNGNLSVEGLYVGQNELTQENGNIGLIAVSVGTGKKIDGNYFLIEKNNADSENAMFSVCENSGTVSINVFSSMQSIAAPKDAVTDNYKVFYASYGAPQKYSARYDTDQIKISEIFAEIDYSGNEDGSFNLRGDGVLKQDDVPNPDYLAQLDWWNKNFGDTLKSKTLLSLLQEKYTTLAELKYNAALPVFVVNGEADGAIKAYLNLMSNGGYSVSDLELSVESVRYKIEKTDDVPTGKLIKTENTGSIVFENGNFKAEVYDVLSVSGNDNITVLTFSFGTGGRQLYSADLVVFNPQKLEVKTYVSAMEGETYFLDSFVNNPSYRKNVSYGSRYTLYIEYAYNNVAESFTGSEISFVKSIYSDSVDGSAGNRKKFYAGTSFILFDLNSNYGYKYRYYYYTLQSESLTVALNDFVSTENTSFVSKTLAGIVANKLGEKTHICQDSDFNVIERYLLVVIPPSDTNGEDASFIFKAKTDSEDVYVISREETGCTVSVWGNPTGEIKLKYPEGGENKFSNTDGKNINATVETEIQFPNDYVLNMQGKKIYGTHVFELKDSSNNIVSLPVGTIFTIFDKEENSLFSERIASDMRSVSYVIEDLIQKANVSTSKYSEKLIVSFDFSEVSSADFAKSFGRSADKNFHLYDTFYISDVKEFYAVGNSFSDSKPFVADIVDEMKLVVNPLNGKQLAVNVSDPSDSTNNGLIEFNVTADTRALVDVEIESVTVTFELYKKEKTEEGKYEYRKQDDALTSKEKFYVTTKKELKEEETAVYEGQYMLQLKLGALTKADYAAYRLEVTATATDKNGEVYKETNYFVFLICAISNLS